MDKLLDAVGLLPLKAKEIDAVKSLGSGYHQEFKLAREAADIPKDLLPLEEASEADPCFAPVEPSQG